ncbi:hypothetical protein [Tsukamurella columbiensis]|uniref:Uncharacterized protein n=1 Tax=Tsukamurella columbiensis TaxID=128509 RepID=A0ABX1LKA4_9ACTN|nr:hypothetical protein [Tsukamurella columbiensis]NMD58159.1 hypothetical protein [Tsukamurella columbiensis]
MPATYEGSVANIPQNVVEAIANIPANQVAGAGRVADALKLSGNWWLYMPSNVLGFDHADLAKVNGLASWLVPFPAVAQALADPINVTMQANFPMTADCTGAPAPCDDPTYWTDYFKVMPWQLVQGVSYGTVRNTIDPSIIMPWSNTTQRIDVFGVPRAIWYTLTKTPEGIKPVPTAGMISSTYGRLGKEAGASLDPMVDGTYCLPCQFVKGGPKGAPGSLSRIPLLGNWYTITDLGQRFTSDNWNNRRPGVPLAPDVDALSLWSEAGQARLKKSIAKAQADQASGRSRPTDLGTEIQKAIDGIVAGVRPPDPTPADLGAARASVDRDYRSLADDVAAASLQSPAKPRARAASATAARPVPGSATAAVSRLFGGPPVTPAAAAPQRTAVVQQPVAPQNVVEQVVQTIAPVVPNLQIPGVIPGLQQPVPAATPAAAQRITPPAPQRITPVSQQRVKPSAPQRITPVSQQGVAPVAVQQVTPAAQQRVKPAAPQRITPVSQQRVAPVAAQQVKPAVQQWVKPAAERVAPVAAQQVKPAMQQWVKPAAERVAPVAAQQVKPSEVNGAPSATPQVRDSGSTAPAKQQGGMVSFKKMVSDAAAATGLAAPAAAVG